MMERGKKGFFIGLNGTLITARCLAAMGVSEERYPGGIVTVAWRLYTRALVCQTSSNLTVTLQGRSQSAVHWRGKSDNRSQGNHRVYYIFHVSLYGNGQLRGAGLHSPVVDREASVQAYMEKNCKK